MQQGLITAKDTWSANFFSKMTEKWELYIFFPLTLHFERLSFFRKFALCNKIFILLQKSCYLTSKSKRIKRLLTIYSDNVFAIISGLLCKTVQQNKLWKKEYQRTIDISIYSFIYFYFNQTNWLKKITCAENTYN